MWDYGSDGSIDLTKVNFLTISFLSGYHYSGGFHASTDAVPDAVPEPATVALLGIGLVGLACGAGRRRLKKAKEEKV